MIQSATESFVEPREQDAVQSLQELQSALRSSGYSLLGKLSVRIRRGTLVLEGNLPSYYLKQLAQELAKRTGLALPIVNEIRVSQAG